MNAFVSIFVDEGVMSQKMTQIDLEKKIIAYRRFRAATTCNKRAVVIFKNDSSK